MLLIENLIDVRWNNEKSFIFLISFLLLLSNFFFFLSFIYHFVWYQKDFFLPHFRILPWVDSCQTALQMGTDKGDSNSSIHVLRVQFLWAVPQRFQTSFWLPIIALNLKCSEYSAAKISSFQNWKQQRRKTWVNRIQLSNQKIQSKKKRSKKIRNVLGKKKKKKEENNNNNCADYLSFISSEPMYPALLSSHSWTCGCDDELKIRIEACAQRWMKG